MFLLSALSNCMVLARQAVLLRWNYWGTTCSGYNLPFHHQGQVPTLSSVESRFLNTTCPGQSGRWVWILHVTLYPWLLVNYSRCMDHFFCIIYRQSQMRNQHAIISLWAMMLLSPSACFQMQLGTFMPCSHPAPRSWTTNTILQPSHIPLLAVIIFTLSKLLLWICPSLWATWLLKTVKFKSSSCRLLSFCIPVTIIYLH